MVLSLLAAFAVGGFGLNLILYLANGGHVFGKSLPQGNTSVAGSPGAQALTAVVSWLGGVAALWTFFVNWKQKDLHANEEEKRERDLAELQRLESEFAALADDFAQITDGARVNAAIGFGEIARNADPRLLNNYPVTVAFEFNSDRIIEFAETSQTNHFKSEKNREQFPYYLRACQRLVAAYRVWDNISSISEARRVLHELIEWAKDPGTDESLLHEVCNLLAEANRTSYRLLEEFARDLDRRGKEKAFILSVTRAEIALHISDPRARIEFDNIVTSWCISNDDHRSLSQDETIVCDSETKVADRLDEEAECNLTRLVRVFCMTSTSLAYALRSLSSPIHVAWPEEQIFPSVEPRWLPGLLPTSSVRGYKSVEVGNIIIFLQTRRNLALQEIKLIGENVYGCNFQGANLQGAKFVSCLAHGSHFQFANLSRAIFLDSECGSSSFQFADLSYARFLESRLEWSAFDDANCCDVVFGNSLLLSSSFRGAFLARARFESSDCTSIVVDGAYIAQARFGLNSVFQAQARTIEWSAAEFHFCRFRGLGRSPMLLEMEDTGLKSQLLGSHTRSASPSGDGDNLPQSLNIAMVDGPGASAEDKPSSCPNMLEE